MARLRPLVIRMGYVGSVEEEQLAALLAGDEAAFAQVWTDLNPRLVRYARVLVGSDAEEVVAEAWSHVVRDLHRFSGTMDGFRGWVSTIARNRAMDHLRAVGRRPVPTDPHEIRFEPAETVGVDAATAAGEVFGTRWAVELIASLPTEQAEAVMLRVVLGLDAPSAAAVLGRRPGAVRTAAHRGLKTLRARLEAGGYEPGNTFSPAHAGELS